MVPNYCDTQLMSCDFAWSRKMETFGAVLSIQKKKREGFCSFVCDEGNLIEDPYR